ncbi:MAG: ChbG/HpnK family deacetylase [Candidatus Marinimicrobia bacterium]|nr:ChbG/HpnK family deacetylase [Candidatus Neomarinimicrobiota bacterium]MCF7904403.1 ChbG/HpnK family deacetylase [Candidatus Neomarinimicrobiota bacterium]
MHIRIGIMIILLAMGSTSTGMSRNQSDTKYYLIRLDDMGMSHGVNMAVKQVIETGLPVSTSVMFACPWYQEAVDILKEHPEVSVGIHLTLNAEWKNYRWGPIAGKDAVPSLVDEHGYFLPARSLLYAQEPKLEEIELELRTQIERAVNSGIKIDYVDYHMGAAVQTIETREVVENLAAEYDLGMMYYFGERSASSTYAPSHDAKLDSLISNVGRLEPGYNLQVVHVALDTPEMQAMEDLNTFGLKEMSKHRQSELNAVSSADFRQAIKDNNLTPITYRQLIDMVGLEDMKRPPLED